MRSSGLILPLFACVGSVLGLECFNDDPSHYPSIKHTMLKADIQHLLDDLTAGTSTTIGGDSGAFSVQNGIHIRHAGGVVIQHKTAQFCMYNTNLLQSTFMPVSQAVSAIQGFIDKCCTDSDECQGGSTEVDGLPPTFGPVKVQVNLFVQSSMDDLNTCLDGLDATDALSAWAAGSGAVTAAAATAALKFGSTIWSAAQKAAFQFGGRLPLAAFHGLFQKAPVNPNFFTQGLGVIVDTEIETDAESDAKIALSNLLNVFKEEGALAPEAVDELSAVLNVIASGAAEVEGFFDDL